MLIGTNAFDNEKCILAKGLAYEKIYFYERNESAKHILETMTN